MSLLNLAILLAVAAALAAIPRRTRKAAILASSLAILASLTAVVYAGARVEKPALGGAGPLALLAPVGIATPKYHAPPETWRAQHFAYVRTSKYGEAECLTCHADPDVFCNQCHNYAGVRLIATPTPFNTPVPTRIREAVGTSTAEGGTATPGTSTVETASTPTAEGGGETANGPSFSRDVQPVLNQRCAPCHGEQGGLSVASRADLLRGGLSGPAILPGDAEGSLLVQSVRGTLKEGERMPLLSAPLTEAEIELIVRWIQAGAQDN
ncbi:MAG: hypothetical protein HY260_22475 [Chloroflexi bacterium]|nr:hypothetical protein [Chloroflexota bacterium]